MPTIVQVHEFHFVRKVLSTQKFKQAIAGIVTSPLFSKKTGTIANHAKATSGWNIDEGQGAPISHKNVLESLPSRIATLSANGYWQAVNPGNNEYLKTINDNNFVNWVSQHVHVQDRVAVLKAVSDCRSLAQEVVVDFRLLNLEQSPVKPKWVEFRCTAIDRKNDTILTIFKDISDHKALEADMQNASDKADAANIGRTRFLANMSHELRTPLNAIIGFSEMLKSGMLPASDVEKHNEYHGLIHESALHLLHVLNDILDMSKMEAGKYEIFPEDIELNQIINSCCLMMEPLAQKANVTLHFASDNDPLNLEADSKAVRQILINLLSNAIKFTRSDTSIIVKAKRVGRSIEFRIRDQGQGISAQLLEGLGEPFYQLDDEKSRCHEGTGLGLSIVKGLVELHNGEFKIESELEVGTSVSVLLPMSQGQVKPVPADEQDTIIRINPNPVNLEKNRVAISRLAG